MKKPTRKITSRKATDRDLILSPARDEELPPRRIRKPLKDEAAGEEASQAPPPQKKDAGKHVISGTKLQCGVSRPLDATDPALSGEAPSVSAGSIARVERPSDPKVLPAEIIPDAAGEPLDSLDSGAVVFRRVGDLSAAPSYRNQLPEGMPPRDPRRDDPAGRARLLDAGPCLDRSVGLEIEPGTSAEESYLTGLSDILIQAPPLPLFLFVLVLILFVLAL